MSDFAKRVIARAATWHPRPSPHTLMVSDEQLEDAIDTELQRTFGSGRYEASQAITQTEAAISAPLAQPEMDCRGRPEHPESASPS